MWISSWNQNSWFRLEIDFKLKFRSRFQLLTTCITTLRLHWRVGTHSPSRSDSWCHPGMSYRLHFWFGVSQLWDYSELSNYLEMKLPLVSRPGDLVILADHNIVSLKEIAETISFSWSQIQTQCSIYYLASSSDMSSSLPRGSSSTPSSSSSPSGSRSSSSSSSSSSPSSSSSRPSSSSLESAGPST